VRQHSSASSGSSSRVLDQLFAGVLFNDPLQFQRLLRLDVAGSAATAEAYHELIPALTVERGSIEPKAPSRRSGRFDAL
jgi:hypothetical protein